MITLLQWIFLGIVIIGGFFLANGFRIKYLYMGNDSYYHYQAAEQIKKKKELYKTIDIYAIPSPPDHPPLIHYMLALFPLKKMLSYGRFLSAGIEIVNKIILFVIAYVLTENYTIAITAVIIHTTINLLNQEQIETSGRTLGSVLYNLLIVSLLLYMTKGNLLFLILSSILVFLTIITHRFAHQVTVFTLLFLAIYYKDINYILTYIGGTLLALVILRKYYWLILQGMIKVYQLWFSMRNIEGKKKRGYNHYLVKIYELICSNMFDLIIIGILLIDKSLILTTEIKFLISIIVFLRILSTAIFIIKQLHCIGEDFRYLTYNALPSAIVLAYLIIHTKNNSYLIITIIACCLSLISLWLWQKENKKNRTYFINEDLAKSIKELKKINTQKMLVLPYTFGKAIGYLTKKKIFLTVSPIYMDYIREIYWKTEDINNIIKKHNITHVAKYKEYQEEIKGKKILENKHFIVYKTG